MSYKYVNYSGIYSGAGIILIEQNYNDNGPAAILFKDIGYNVYSDLGGGIAYDKSMHNYTEEYILSETARREAFEESGCLINFNDINAVGMKINNVNMFVNHNTYRCYFICIPSGTFYSKYYHENISKIFASNLPHYFKETNNVRRFYLKDIISNNMFNKNGHMYCLDATGAMRLINNRTWNCIEKAFLNNIINITISLPRYIKYGTINVRGLDMNALMIY
jgi:hypothetical protein